MSNLTAVQLAFLQRLFADKPASTPITQVARYFNEHFGLGFLAGRSIDFSTSDHEKVCLLLQAYRQSAAPVPRNARRSQAQRPGISEKIGTIPPNADSLAMKCAAGRCTIRGSDQIIGPAGYSVLGLDDALRVEVDCIMVVENMETFRHIADQLWIDYQQRNVLAVFHGDDRFKGDEVKHFLLARSEPVWAFMDFDPAGLGYASLLPRMQRLILPEASVLRIMVDRAERTDLYAKNFPQWSRTLDAIESGPIAESWRLMKSLQSALPQEHMGD